MSNKVIYSGLLFCVLVAGLSMYVIQYHKDNYVSKDKLICLETRTVTIPGRCGLWGCPALDKTYEKCVKYQMKVNKGTTIQNINGNDTVVIGEMNKELIINNYNNGEKEVIEK